MSLLIPTIVAKKKRGDLERGKSRLISPNPRRVKFVTDLLAKLTEGKITFASVMKLEKKKIIALAEQGQIKLRYGRYEEARKIFEILCFVDHKNAYYHLSLGGAYHKLKMQLDAAFQYTECIKYDSQNTNALVNRGEIFFRHKNYKRAAEDFRAAILLDKTGKDLYANRARSLVIALKRTLAKNKGDTNPTLPSNISARKKVKPAVIMGRTKVATYKKM